MSFADTGVRFFNNSMVGAPALQSTTAGSMVNILKACLIDGFGSVNLASLVISNGIATGTVNTGHNFTMRGNTGPAIFLSGITFPAPLNGVNRVLSVPNSTTFTFDATGYTDQTASGAISVKRAPIPDMQLLYDEGMSLAFKRTAVDALPFILSITDSTTTMSARLFSTATGATTTNDPILVTSKNMIKGSGGSSRYWSLIGDGKMFYFLCDMLVTNSYTGFMQWGDLINIAGTDSSNNYLSLYDTNFSMAALNATGKYLARSYTQTGVGVTAKMGSISLGAYAYSGASFTGIPQPTINGTLLVPLYIAEDGVGVRGILRGAWNPLADQPFEGILSNVMGMPGRDFITLWSNYQTHGVIAFDITGPWGEF